MLDGHTAFYREILDGLDEAGVPFLIGGAFGLFHYTGIHRDTKDLDIFVKPEDCARAMDAAARRGYESRVQAPHWLAKVTHDGGLVDFIFSSGNGLARVDDEWFAHAREGTIAGRTVRVVPAEEMVWSKAFIMERHRYDGADVAHVLRWSGAGMDWHRLLRRFETHWHVLLSHVVLYLYIYPMDRESVPTWVLRELTRRTLDERERPPAHDAVCRGTFLSNFQYVQDLDRHGYSDARLEPLGPLTAEQIAIWNAHLRSETPPQQQA